MANTKNKKKTTRKTKKTRPSPFKAMGFVFDRDHEIEVLGWTTLETNTPIVTIDAYDGTRPYNESMMTSVDVTDPNILRDLADTLLKAAAWMEKNK
jgi:hypothetical protein